MYNTKQIINNIRITKNPDFEIHKYYALKQNTNTKKKKTYAAIAKTKKIIFSRF